MDINLKYIEENYVEYKKLCKMANISSDELEELIYKELIPNASYTINSTDTISSPLGDKVMVNEIKKFFPKNTLELIKNNKALANEPANFKERFKQEFLETLESSIDKRYAYNGILDENGKIDNVKLDLEFEDEWKYYCKGVYGVCTLNATGSDIIKKEIAVKKLIEFNEINVEKKLSGKEKDTLISLNAQFNEVSNLFAPYQREVSSRGKYLDKILKLNKMDELIKNR
ncbi:MAG: DUF6058 family natural product biosynthesis protein [Reichenbachiella sp.]